MPTFEYEGKQVTINDDGIFLLDKRRFENFREVVAYVKRVSREKYQPVEAFYIGYKGVSRVTVTRPHDEKRCWVTRADKSRDTVDNSELVSVECEAELNELLNKKRRRVMRLTDLAN